MATEKTILNNVVSYVADDEQTTNATDTNTTEDANPQQKNSKSENNRIDYAMGFDGSEEIKWKPEVFEAFGKTIRMNSAELSRKIYAHFKQTFHELKGCNISILPNSQISVDLYFEKNLEPVPDGKIKNLDSLIEPSSSGPKKNLYECMQVANNRRLGKIFTLNNETRLLLSKFMYGGSKVNLPDSKVWENETVQREVHIPVTNDPFIRSYNTDRILVRISGIDIRKILQELYGKTIVYKTVTDEHGDINFTANAMYEVRVMKGLPDGTFIMNIEQFDKDAIEKIFMKENPIPQHYLGVQMYN